ncbi:hypothetical protein OBBRIDRAFT_812474 [Obba rivulosa]|uniref:Uncharacterized protein n=1 Tax=Obba rivulosa TaxID=1052685 RepID=A0A8E2ATS9_9APHY|nr:hypothetical protein OBBRIDRAFT_812474 [Obba rivulosa]
MISYLKVTTITQIQMGIAALKEKVVEPLLALIHLSALQRNSASPQDFKQKIPKPVVVVTKINGHPAQALLDSRSLADFIVKTFELEKLLPMHLAVQSSRAKINIGCHAELKYQSIKKFRYFDVVNLLNYNLILGTPFWFQHQISVGLNPAAVIVRSPIALPIEGSSICVLESQAADIYKDALERAHQVIHNDTPLPPLRVINYTILLKDESKIYHWHPSKCLNKHNAYLKTGRWQISNMQNISPMLLLTKPGMEVKGVSPRL